MDRLELRVGSLGGVDMRICTAPRDGLVSDKLYWAAGKRIGRTNPNQKTYHVNYIPKQVRWQRLGTCMSILSYSTCCWKMSQRSTNTNRRFGARRSCQIQRCNQYRLLPWLQRATVYSGENQTTQFKSACNSAPETALRFPHGGGGGLAIAVSATWMEWHHSTIHNSTKTSILSCYRVTGNPDWCVKGLKADDSQLTCDGQSRWINHHHHPFYCFFFLTE